ncbi:MAG TPA: diacylglycerol kinase family protein [Flavobacteriaceae bacterium]|nr:diacylglycerol kinase family protein [Flavobacteriaceae bacterium]HPF10801.1 diacylglycerol kinase family protein [Flavobacteriaceae bacterium]HQU20990.1 diacylglycerol kinase family protein [Flavobacteriaceae bacterium]HQU66268.1 diacylglycerol kinase family protein [Flavobacteriaceae bacterium]HRW44542.1 diacylglycerol kinase family protein [Flavobacteriaceae bacterium]
MWNTFVGKRILGFKYAFRGAWMLLKNEASIQVQAAIAIIMTGAGFYFQISTMEWIAQCLAIGLVLSIEGLNTAAEEIANFVHPDYHNKIGYIKDVAAGAVFFAAITAIVVGGFIYIPKF